MNNRSEMNVCCNSCSRPSTDCPNTDPLRGMPLGIGYVPVQEWGQTYCPDKALQRGTIFPPLDLPFCGCIPKGFRCQKGGLSWTEIKWMGWTAVAAAIRWIGRTMAVAVAIKWTDRTMAVAVATKWIGRTMAVATKWTDRTMAVATKWTGRTMAVAVNLWIFHKILWICVAMIFSK